MNLGGILQAFFCWRVVFIMIRIAKVGSPNVLLSGVYPAISRSYQFSCPMSKQMSSTGKGCNIWKYTGTWIPWVQLKRGSVDMGCSTGLCGYCFQSITILCICWRMSEHRKSIHLGIPFFVLSPTLARWVGWLGPATGHPYTSEALKGTNFYWHCILPQWNYSCPTLRPENTEAAAEIRRLNILAVMLGRARAKMLGAVRAGTVSPLNSSKWIGTKHD